MDTIIIFVRCAGLTCLYHGEYAPMAYYDDTEITQMIDEQGFIDCPLCMTEIIGIGE